MDEPCHNKALQFCWINISFIYKYIIIDISLTKLGSLIYSYINLLECYYYWTKDTVMLEIKLCFILLLSNTVRRRGHENRYRLLVGEITFPTSLLGMEEKYLPGIVYLLFVHIPQILWAMHLHLLQVHSSHNSRRTHHACIELGYSWQRSRLCLRLQLEGLRSRLCPSFGGVPVSRGVTRKDMAANDTRVCVAPGKWEYAL